MTGRCSYCANFWDVYVHASGVWLDWEMVAHAAQGRQDTDLLAVATGCHSDTFPQVRWAGSRMKECSAQILLS